MAKRPSKSQPAWTDVKAKLATLDRQGLLGLIQDLYAAHKDNQVFLHTRFGVGEDPLKPYKQTIDRWLWPDVFRRQDTSVTKARQAVSNYKKVVGDTAGLVELMVSYCERAAGFCIDLGESDESYLRALVRTFEDALALANTLPPHGRDNLIARLEGVCDISQKIGYGVGEAMDFARATFMEED